MWLIAAKIAGILIIKRLILIYQAISDYGLFRVLETPFTLPSFKGEQISLFSLDLKAQFTSKNLKYPLKNLRLKTLFSGSLNEATDHFF
ncbi:thiamine pyrophosphokinase [Helicobacter pylori SS1]|nr:thiamine pyrophosphokinase [Helicobacter pylori SS1]